MFQEPSRRKDGTNLRREEQPPASGWPGSAGRCRGVKRGVGVSATSPSSPLVEAGEAVLHQQGEEAAEHVAVLPGAGVHVPRLHHVHRRRHQRGAEAGAEGGHEMAGDVVCRAELSVVGRGTAPGCVSPPQRRPHLSSAAPAAARP